eukprot:GGOE01010294.1.p1 GENE.GGOE01010294.1~~GGOE01010294.1.p1  ORF type:complete len:470 (-),score=143.94 GGOE01010294.1:270-1640(-)
MMGAAHGVAPPAPTPAPPTVPSQPPTLLSLSDAMKSQLSSNLRDRWSPVTQLATTPWSVVLAVVSTEEDVAAVLKCVERRKLPGLDFEALLAAVRRTPEDGNGMVATVYDAELTPDFLFIVQERFECSFQDLVVGSSFHNPQKSVEAIRKAYAAPTVADMVRRLCEAVLAIHEMGAVHGAICLSNVLLRQQGNAIVACLAPFGLPLRHDVSDALTPHDLCFSPDQIQEPPPGYQMGYKTKLCMRWEASGECSWGNACGFAHGDADLRPRHGQLVLNPVLSVESAGHAKLSQEADIFALGCVLYGLASRGQHPIKCEGDTWLTYCKKLQDVGQTRTVMLQSTVLREEDEEMELLLLDLVQGMLTHSCDMADVLAHPFFWEAKDFMNFYALQLADGVMEDIYKHTKQSSGTHRPREFLESAVTASRAGNADLVMQLVKSHLPIAIDVYNTMTMLLRPQ